MKIVLQFCLLLCFVNLIVSQIFYPGIKVHRIAVLQNGNVTEVPFIERASPAPLVPRDVRGRRLQVATTTVNPVSTIPPSPAPLAPQVPSEHNVK